MKIKSIRKPVDNSKDENWMFNEGSRITNIDEQKKTYWVERVNEAFNEGEEDTQSFVAIDSNINNGSISKQISEVNTPIKSKIDGAIDYTNVQDENFASDLSSEESWKQFGTQYGKLAGNAATNILGVSNSQISNVAGLFGAGSGEDSITTYDKNMVKLNELKEKKYKDLHPFDWKPGQTIPKDLMKSSLASMTKDWVDGFGSEGFKKGFKKVEDYVSPDPVNYARESIKRTKGIYSTIDGDQSEFTTKIDNFVDSYTITNGSESVSSVWRKSEKPFSPFNKSDDEIKFINALKNKNTFNKTLGYIYIKPNINYINNYNLKNEKNKEGTGIFQIPFEFNPEISEGDYQANYVSETLLNRIGQFQIYTGTNLSQLNISLKYMALSPDNIDREQNNSMGKEFATDAWQYYWTNNRIEDIEYKLRSLVFPDMTSRDYLVKPPIIEVHVGNEMGSGAEDVGDLYKYPIEIDANNEKNDEKYLATTRSVINGKINRYKKYIVTSVQIESLNDDSFIWPSLYGRVWSKEKNESGSPVNHIKTGRDLGNSKEEIGFSGYARRLGFKANLRCIEVTENFLDLVPDFKSYYDAWTYKEYLSNKVYDHVQNIWGGIEETSNNLSKISLTAISIEDGGNNVIESNLNNYFEDAYIQAKLYNNLNSSGKILNDYDLSLQSKTKIGDSFYFINSLWNEKVKEKLLKKEEKPVSEEEAKSSEDNSGEYNIDGPIVFNIKLDNSFESFIDKFNKNDMDEIYSNKDTNFDSDKGKPINALSKVVKQELFYGGSGEDILKIYGENSIMDLLCNKSGKNTDFTDKECFYMLKRIAGLRDNLKEKINEIDKIENPIPYIKNMFYIMILASENGTASPDKGFVKEQAFDYKNNKCYPILKNKMTNSYKYLYGSTDEVGFGGEEHYSNIYNINRLSYWDKIRMDNELKKFPNLYNGAKKIVIENKLLNLLKKDMEANDNKNGKKFFKELKTYLKDNNASPELINLLTNKLYDIYMSCLNSILESIEYSEKIVNADQSYVLSSIEAGEYLIMSVEKGNLLGNNIKMLKKSSKKYNCHIYTTYEQDLGKDQKYAEEMDIYDTYVKDQGIMILSIKYIMDQMIDSSKEALDELRDLSKSVSKIDTDTGNDYNEYLKAINKIKFDNKEDETNINNDVDKFIKNQKELIENIKNLKRSLNKDKVQDNFSKIAGKYEYVKGLKPLSDEGSKSYSSSKEYLRKNVFKEWDECFGFDIAGNLINEGDKGFQELFKNTENGIIPNEYYRKYTNDNIASSLQIANNNINSVNNLT